MTITEHGNYEELLGAYALDALGADENMLMDSHLETCEACQADLSSLLETLVEVAPQNPDYDPEPLWEKIEAAISQAAVREGNVTPLRRRPQIHFPRISTAVASVVIIAAFVATGSSLYNSNSRANGVTSISKLQSQIIAKIEKAPGHRDVELISTGGKYHISMVISSTGLGYITSSNLPTLSSAKTYQLWGIKNTGMVSIGILGPAGKETQFLIPKNSNFAELAISLEPSGGTSAPTTAPIVSGVV